MKAISVMSLTPGMILGEDVVSQGKVIYPAGTRLNQNMIGKIMDRYSLEKAIIMEDTDLASTHYEKIRFNEHFQMFEQTYNVCLMRYKSLMMTFLQTGMPIPDEALVQIYNDLYATISSGSVLLDFLYNLTPNEDDLTFSHSLNSALLAGTIADWLVMNQMAKRNMILCGFYYDIGKLQLPYELLWKPGKLTPEEFQTVQTHPMIGYNLVRGLDLNIHVKNAIIMHHERLDGSGYPYHMQGEKIDIYARYIAIVDAYIAMASPRSYRNALTPLQIVANFEENMTRYDIELLMTVMNRIASAQIGTRVQTNDGRVWEVLIIQNNKLSRPIIKNDENEVLNLLEHPELEIVKMM